MLTTKKREENRVRISSPRRYPSGNSRITIIQPDYRADQTFRILEITERICRGKIDRLRLLIAL